MTDLARIKPPAGLKEMNEDLMAQQRQGTLGFDLPVLTVPGRRSGTPRHTPLTVLERDGQRFVVGGFPGADWIRNVRAAGRRPLTLGSPGENLLMVERVHAEAKTVLREWPATTPDGVQMMLEAGVVTDTTPDALEAVAGVCPVFRVEAE